MTRLRKALQNSLGFGGVLQKPQADSVAFREEWAPTGHAPMAIVDAIAVADVEALLGAIPPDRMLNEPRKVCRE
jgi:hypothetical protein